MAHKNSKYNKYDFSPDFSDFFDGQFWKNLQKCSEPTLGGRAVQYCTFQTGFYGLGTSSFGGKSVEFFRLSGSNWKWTFDGETVKIWIVFNAFFEFHAFHAFDMLTCIYRHLMIRTLSSCRMALRIKKQLPLKFSL